MVPINFQLSGKTDGPSGKGVPDTSSHTGWSRLQGEIPDLSGCCMSQVIHEKTPLSQERISLAWLEWAIPGVFVLVLPGIPRFGAADVALLLLIVLQGQSQVLLCSRRFPHKALVRSIPQPLWSFLVPGCLVRSIHCGTHPQPCGHPPHLPGCGC